MLGLDVLDVLDEGGEGVLESLQTIAADDDDDAGDDDDVDDDGDGDDDGDDDDDNDNDNDNEPGPRLPASPSPGGSACLE